MPEAHRRTPEAPYHGLRTKPFRENTDPAFLWLGPPYREALGTLRTAVLENAGVLLLTGEVGMGKTMLARALGDRLSAEGVRVGKLGHLALNPDEFRAGVVRAFGVQGVGDARAIVATAFGEFLRAAHALGEKVLLIVDEAQNMDAALLDEVGELIAVGRRAGNGTVNVLNILLVAQPGLDSLLRRRKGPDGRDFVAVRAHLRPLDVAQVADYVAFRLRAAGAERELFSVDAVGEVASMSGGVPRLVNQICDRTLIATSPWNGCMVSAGVVRGALREADANGANVRRRRLARGGVRIVAAAGGALALTLGLLLYHGKTASVANAPWRDGEARPGTPTAAESPPATPTDAKSASSTDAASTGAATATAPATDSSASTAPAASAPTAPATSAPAATAASPPAPAGASSDGVASDRRATNGTGTASVTARTAGAAHTTSPRAVERRAGEPRGIDSPERAAPRAITNPSAPRDEAQRAQRAQVDKPRSEPVAPARAPAPAPVTGVTPRPVTPAAPTAPRETPPEPARSPRTGGSEGGEDPSAIIDWLLQRSPGGGR